MIFLSGSQLNQFNLFTLLSYFIVTLSLGCGYFGVTTAQIDHLSGGRGGMTMNLDATLALWLPWINAAKSYKQVMMKQCCQKVMRVSTLKCR
jgi:hypothetical protein